jgi:type IV pilus assembly protein PilV
MSGLYSMKQNRKRAAQGSGRSRGFTLVEALVALLALSIGLLGVAGLQLTGLYNNVSSSYRSRATYLSYDITDRIRANLPADPGIAPSYYDAAYGAAPTPANVVAAQDLLDWKGALAATLPSGDGKVEVNGRVITVTVTWDDTKGVGGLLEFSTVTQL